MDKCGTYRTTAAELIVAKQGSGKKDYIRFSLMKVKKNGRIDKLGFSHYFNVGIEELVKEYKALGVTEKGISQENLMAAKAAYNKEETDVQFDFFGFFWNQPLGGVYRHKETGTVSSDILVFIPCDEETGVPKPEWAMTQARLNDILKNYEKVQTSTNETEPSVVEQSSEEDEQAQFEEFLRMKREANS